MNSAVYIPGNSTTGNTNARRVFALARPYGQYYGSAITVDTAGNASYNGMLLTLQHRMSHNFSILANYTWSHCLNQGEAGQDIVNYYQDPLNRRAEWGNCAADRRQIANASVVFKTPQFHSTWIQRMAGNWQASGIYTFTSGSWLTMTDGTDVSLTGLGTDRPNVGGDWKGKVCIKNAVDCTINFPNMTFTELTTWGEDREDALQRAVDAMEEALAATSRDTCTC